MRQAEISEQAIGPPLAALRHSARLSNEIVPSPQHFHSTTAKQPPQQQDVDLLSLVHRWWTDGGTESLPAGTAEGSCMRMNTAMAVRGW